MNRLSGPIRLCGQSAKEASSRRQLVSKQIDLAVSTKMFATMSTMEHADEIKERMMEFFPIRATGLFLRLALGFSFLSAVADRFGLWGPLGRPHVAWGSFERFLQYTGQLNWYLPRSLVSPIAWAATILETLLGVFLILGLFTRLAALASGALLLSFAVTMAIALGVKAPLDCSVFSASAGAFLLASLPTMSLLSLDRLLARVKRAKRPRS